MIPGEVEYLDVGDLVEDRQSHFQRAILFQQHRSRCTDMCESTFAKICADSDKSRLLNCSTQIQRKMETSTLILYDNQYIAYWYT